MSITAGSPQVGSVSVYISGTAGTIRVGDIPGSVAVYFDRGNPGVNITSGTLTGITNTVAVWIPDTGHSIGTIQGITTSVTVFHADTGHTIGKVDAGVGTFATSEVAPTTIYNGKKTVTTAGTRVTLAASQAVKSVTIKALVANTGTIFVGDGSVASTNGFALAAGDSISIDIGNLATVNLDSSVNGEGVTYIAIN